MKHASLENIKETNPQWIMTKKVNDLITDIEDIIFASDTTKGFRLILDTDEGRCTNGIVTIGTLVTPKVYSCFSYTDYSYYKPTGTSEKVTKLKLGDGHSDETVHLNFKNVRATIKCDACKIICEILKEVTTEEATRIKKCAEEIISLVSESTIPYMDISALGDK